jgi:hypothetical protein
LDGRHRLRQFLVQPALFVRTQLQRFKDHDKIA